MEPNLLFPGRPNYTGPTAGLFGLVHHNVLFEPSSDILERVKFIPKSKPLNAIETRLWVIVYLDPSGQPWARAWAQRARARIQWDKALTHFDKAMARMQSTEGMTEAEKSEARTRMLEARTQWEKAELGVNRHSHQIEAQISSLIPDLPWNGHHLVFPAV